MGFPLQEARMRVSTPILFLIFFFYYPLWKVITLVNGDGLHFLFSDYVLDRLAGAFQQAFLSVALTLALAVPLAFYYHHRPGKQTRAQLAIHAAPFVLPVFVVIFGMQSLFGATGWTKQVFGLDFLATIGPLGVIALAHAYYNVGFAARLLTTGLDARPRRLEAAAATLGAGRAQRWLRVIGPALLPRLTAVALLVFFFSFTSFAVVLFFGQGQIGTFETLIYNEMAGAFPNRGNAAALAILQLVTNAVFLFAYLRLSNVRLTPESNSVTRRPMLGWVWVTITLLPVLAVFVETSPQAWASLLPGHGRTPAGFNLWVVLGRSLFYAFTAGFLAVSLSLLLARGKRGALLAGIPLGTSSVVLGFGLFLAFGPTAPGWLDWRSTKWLIILAHTLVAFPFTYRILHPAYASRDTRLEEVARNLGAHRDLFWRVQLPLLRGPLLVAAGFSFALSLGDFGASLLLMSSENMGLSVWINRMDRPFDAFAHQQALAASALLMMLTIAAYLLIERFRTPQSEF